MLMADQPQAKRRTAGLLKCRLGAKLLFGLVVVAGLATRSFLTSLVLKPSSYPSMVGNRHQSGDRSLQSLPTLPERPPDSLQLISSKNYSSEAESAMGSYWDLSCPMEWSKYSCSRHGDKEEKSGNAFDFAWTGDNLDSAVRAVEAVVNGTLGNRRIVMVGDSLLRQVFISAGCLLSSLTTQRRVDWKESWPCSTLNCVTRGAHSGFDTAALQLKSGAEIHFYPLAGSLHGANEEPDAAVRMHREHAQLRQVQFGKYVSPFGGNSTLGPSDVIVFNSGIHASGIDSQCIETALAASIGVDFLADPMAPRLVYVATPSQHFKSDDGTFGGSPDSSPCVTSLPKKTDPRQDTEKLLLVPGVSVDAFLDNVDYENLGDLHIGLIRTTLAPKSKKQYDCSHFCQPGVPDVVASGLINLLSELEDKRDFEVTRRVRESQSELRALGMETCISRFPNLAPAAKRDAALLERKLNEVQKHVSKITSVESKLAHVAATSERVARLETKMNEVSTQLNKLSSMEDSITALKDQVAQLAASLKSD